MGLADRMDDVPGDFDALDFTWGVDCGRTTPSEWCFYREPHEHGFACDRTCPCRTDQERWRQDTNRENRAEPKHTESCAERCNHCQVCGDSILYGSRCPDHYQGADREDGSAER